MSCIEVIDDLSRSIDDVNTEILKNMIDEKTSYADVCIKPNLTYEHYFKSLKQRWERIINDYLNKPEKCSSGVMNVLFMYDVVSKLNEQRIATQKSGPSTNILETVGNLTPRHVEALAYDKMVDTALDMIRSDSSPDFTMDVDMVKTMKNLASVLGENCSCQMLDIFNIIMSKYKSRYAKKLEGKSREESIDILKRDYEYIKDAVIRYGNSFKYAVDGAVQDTSNNVGEIGEEPKQNTTGNSMDVLNFSIEAEMGRLIPDELGSLKAFFIKVISRYYNNLHPIIWAQIFRSMINNIFVDLPMTPAELFSFSSKYLLLNSGPFILKILQMIRPVLSDDLAARYNLTKLSYPLLEQHQVDLILKKVVVDYDMLKITYNKSASVGHVCIGYDVRRPDDKFVIKIIKPLAVAQSCWEYSILKDLFPKGSCEDSFIKNTLRSNGAEMNVANEITNLERGNANYTTDYNTEFGIDIDASLTTITHKKGIVKDNTWYALAMSLAPGIPLADLVESNMLENDTKFRANLHRCLDLLVTKFFYVLISQGFYHGDLHAGNIFYSFKNRQMTMIDFGAMGDIDLFKNDETTATLLLIIVMSINYDYDGILDVLTDILNSKCADDKSVYIDKNSEEYKQFKVLLVEHKLKNILNAEKEKELSTRYLEDLESDLRLDSEKIDDTLHILKPDTEVEDREPSIYDELERTPETKEIVVENRDILPQFTEVLGETDSISFAGVMQLIVKFYASSGVNIAIKFAELNELQKAYALLLGVLAKTGYSSYRMGMAIKTGVLSWGHLPKLLNVATTYKVISAYRNESSKYGELKEMLEEAKKEWILSRARRMVRTNERRSKYNEKRI